MNVRQLEEFIGSGDQRVFHILTVTHFYGGIGGTLAGGWILQPILGIWGVILGAGLGIVSTWKRNGRPLYGWALAYVRFAVRELFKMGDAVVDESQYYSTRALRSVPHMVMRSDGSVLMVNRGSDGSHDVLGKMLVVPSSQGIGVGRGRVKGNVRESDTPSRSPATFAPPAPAFQAPSTLPGGERDNPGSGAGDGTGAGTGAPPIETNEVGIAHRPSSLTAASDRAQAQAPLPDQPEYAAFPNVNRMEIEAWEL